IVAQSGAFGSHVYVMARDRGLGLSYWCATGNEADVDVADCIAFCARDPSTRVILSYMEGCKDGDKLRAALELARQAGKPVVIMKVGSSDVGAEAAQSHTAALAGADRVYDAVFRQHGVYRAESINDMLDVAYACGAGRFPTGRRLAAVTISGGAGVLMADRAAKVGLEMPEMPEAAQRELKELISFSSPRNPVDVTAQALNDRSLLRRFVDVTLEQDCYDAVIVFLAMVGLFRPMMDEFHKMLDEMRRGAPDKLIALSMIVEEEDRKRAEEKGFPVFEEPSNAVDAVAALARFAEAFARPPMAAIEARPIELDRRPNEYQALRLLAGAGVGVVDARLATNADEAVAAATDLGGPVAMKICSADILHKSDIGGVRLGVSGADDVREAFDRIMAVARSASPSAMIDGVILQPMAARGVETIIGVQRDPVFGPVVMFGLGGILVEALEDVTFRVAPFDVAEARRMIDEIKGRKILDGVRGAPPADIDALAETLSRLSAVAAASAETIDSIDINPFVLGAKGEGGMALDAVILPRLNG
ncbi:MAG: acetate--CoA ligase family protein, partial [Minwuiales bacterium]|nr:acetate--CoA ligase family protein [Minwuiales bacterium]